MTLTPSIDTLLNIDTRSFDRLVEALRGDLVAMREQRNLKKIACKL